MRGRISKVKPEGVGLIRSHKLSFPRLCFKSFNCRTIGSLASYLTSRFLNFLISYFCEKNCSSCLYLLGQKSALVQHSSL